MDIKQFYMGGDRNFGYLVADTDSKEALIIDPSYSPEKIVRYAQENGYTVKYVFNTHNHYDHTEGNDKIKSLTGKKALLFDDVDSVTGMNVKDNARFFLGTLQVSIIHTPGHTDDSICIYLDSALFTGDTLFVGKVGGTDFEKGARKEYDSLHNKIFILPDETRIFPGHDYGTKPESTIGYERKTNPFLLQSDFKSFVDLKRNWASYKREHGIL